MTYYVVYREIDGARIGGVEAASADEAVFRLVGGEYGRDDFYAVEGGN